MQGNLSTKVKRILAHIKSQGLYRGHEKVLTSCQGTKIRINDLNVLNFCSNNYLGLANDALVIKSATNALISHGFGLSSGRIICGTQDIHKVLEEKLAKFHDMEDCMLYTSCFDANAGIFEVLLSPEDSVFSDELNHASIIDGIRLCKANKKEKYKHADMIDLASKMTTHGSSDINLVVTDGVFSMDGDIAPLDKLVEMQAKFPNMYILVDECHAAGRYCCTSETLVKDTCHSFFLVYLYLISLLVHDTY